MWGLIVFYVVVYQYSRFALFLSLLLLFERVHDDAAVQTFRNAAAPVFNRRSPNTDHLDRMDVWICYDNCRYGGFVESARALEGFDAVLERWEAQLRWILR